MKQSVRFIRHGESNANAGQATDDPHLIDLTDLGWQQALDIAASFQDPPDLIIHSPMRRSIMTAMPTMQRFPDVTVMESEIEEFTYLDPLRCKGTTAAERKAWVEAYWKVADVESYDDGFKVMDYLEGKRPRCESFNDFVGRVSRFAVALTEGMSDYVTGDLSDCLKIAVFGHGQHLLRTHIELMRIFRINGGAAWDKRYIGKRGNEQVKSDMRVFPSLLKDMHMSNGESRYWVLDGHRWRKAKSKSGEWPS